MWRVLTLCVFCLALRQGDKFKPDEIRNLVPKTVDCLLEQIATPCRTIEYREHSWRKGPRGIVTVEEFRERGIRAWDQDWSGADTTEVQLIQYYFWRETAKRTRINRPSTNELVVIDHQQQTFWVNRGALGTATWEADNSACEVAASHYWFSDWRLVGRSNVAGIDTVRYSGVDMGGAHQDIDFAPSLGCERFRHLYRKRNGWGFTTEWTEWQVTSYDLGRPRVELFNVPAGYTRMQSP